MYLFSEHVIYYTTKPFVLKKKTKKKRKHNFHIVKEQKHAKIKHKKKVNEYLVIMLWG